MSNAFNNFLSSTGDTVLRDYQHGNRLYVNDTYARAPKFGFIYFVQININSTLALEVEPGWTNRDLRDIGLLAKRADLPRFSIATETLNQYNRKTLAHTKLNYQPIAIELHDDNSNITHRLWKAYYKHHVADSNRSDIAFKDTKYGITDYTYGFYDNKAFQPFLESIDIFVLNQGQFTKYTLVNPKITEWAHDSVNQSESAKVLQNKMTVAYENVYYDEGIIVPGQHPENWIPVYYDNTPSPLAIGGNTQNEASYTRAASSFDQPGKSRVYGRTGGSYQSGNPLLDIAAIVAKNYLNKNGLGKAGPVGYNVASGVLGVLGGGSGKYSEPLSTQGQPGIFNLPGGVGINIFKGLNTSVDGKIRANPAALIFPKGR
jgi:hypothetical protein